MANYKKHYNRQPRKLGRSLISGIFSIVLMTLIGVIADQTKDSIK